MMALLLHALGLREPRCVQAEVRHCLLIELSGRMQLLALLELLHGVLGLVAPASIRPASLEAVLVERLLDLPYLASRQVLRRDRLIVLRGLLLAVLLGLLIPGVLLVLLALSTLSLVLLTWLLALLRLLPLRLLPIVVGCSEGRGRSEHSGRE